MDAQQEPADELLARARRVYAECGSYSDEGKLTTHHYGPGTDSELLSTERIDFRTRWKHPNWFYFEYAGVGTTIGHPGGVFEPVLRNSAGRIWCTPDGVHSWGTHRPEVEDHESLDYALMTATAFLGGPSHHIANLLRATKVGRFPSPEGAMGESDAQVGTGCIKVSVEEFGWEHVFWVERASGLVRRYDTQFTVDSMRGILAGMRQNITDARELGKVISAERENAFRRVEEQARRPLRPYRVHNVALIDAVLHPQLTPADFHFVPPNGA